MSSVSTEALLNFQVSESQQLITQMVRDFCEKNIRPKLMEWDEAQTFPREVFHGFGELGLMGVLVPEEYGGAGLGYHEYIAIITEVSRVCGSIGLSLAAHNSLCTGHILTFGNAAQKAKYLPKLASGEWLGAWALTEPNTGSDSGNMKCTAEQDGDYWVLNGTKCWITHGKSGDVYVILARTGAPRSRNNCSAFIVEKNTPGLSGGKKENKLGMRASETTEVILDHVRVPKENLMGKVGDGFPQAMKVLEA